MHVPAGADQAERVLLSLGEALGGDAMALVDAHLTSDPDQPKRILDQIGERLVARPLLVDGWDAVEFAGLDQELGLALRPRAQAIRDWLSERASVIVGHFRAPLDRDSIPTPWTPPVDLVNGDVQDTADLWVRVGQDPSAFVAALACRALGAAEDEVGELPEPALRARVVELLPRNLLRAFCLISVHARPISPGHVPGGLDARALALGQDLGLWSCVGSQLVPEPGWIEFAAREIDPGVCRPLHLELANSFLADFRPGDEIAPAVALSVLEAHRHLVAAGEYERARECWRYGAPMLVEAARRASITGDHAKAARLYGAVVEATDRGELAMPRQLRGYARHYLHFNRGHGELESLAVTERGYRQALEDWPGNALFWSRLVRVVCFQDRLGAARVDLARAQEVVDPHPQKQTVLVARTVRGLLDKGRLFDAVCLWDGYSADTPFAQEVEQRLHAALEGGWTVQRLILDPDAPLVFVRSMQVRVVRGGGRWSAELPSLDVYGDGPSPLEALRGLVATLREDAGRLLQAYTTDLAPTERLRKRRLLGAVDVLASRVEAPHLSAYWFFGTLHRDDQGALWLRTGGERDLWFEVPDTLDVGVDDLPHLGRVATDHRGVPVGPVLELKPGFRGSEEDLWDAWRRLVNAG